MDRRQTIAAMTVKQRKKKSRFRIVAPEKRMTRSASREIALRAFIALSFVTGADLSLLKRFFVSYKDCKLFLLVSTAIAIRKRARAQQYLTMFIMFLCNS